MQNLVIAAVLAFGGYWLLRQFQAASPKQSSLLIRKVGGGACIAVAGFLTLRGAFAAAMPLFVFGLGLWGTTIPMPWAKKTPGQRSQVKTAILDMQLDHDSGRMDGRVLSGEYQGRMLSSLKDGELKRLGATCAGSKDQSLALFQAWLDRNRPGWRETWAAGAASPNRSSSRMTSDEALAVLGLKKGASPDDIRAAHRRLMKDFHPDRGGSDYLASKINEAKDCLLQD